MVRPTEFDRQKALVSAMDCFWQHGYQAAGMALLLKNMQISRSSFYNSFGDKRSLFIECATLYADKALQVFTAITQSKQGVAAVRQFLQLTLAAQTELVRQRGCLLVNSVSELTGVDEVLRADVLRVFCRIREAWKQQLQLDELTLEAEEASEWIFSLLLGWRLQSQAGIDAHKLATQIDWSLDQLELDKQATPLLSR